MFQEEYAGWLGTEEAQSTFTQWQQTQATKKPAKVGASLSLHHRASLSLHQGLSIAASQCLSIAASQGLSITASQCLEDQRWRHNQ